MWAERKAFASPSVSATGQLKFLPKWIRSIIAVSGPDEGYMQDARQAHWKLLYLTKESEPQGYSMAHAKTHGPTTRQTFLNVDVSSIELFMRYLISLVA